MKRILSGTLVALSIVSFASMADAGSGRDRNVRSGNPPPFGDTSWKQGEKRYYTADCPSGQFREYRGGARKLGIARYEGPCRS